MMMILIRVMMKMRRLLPSDESDSSDDSDSDWSGTEESSRDESSTEESEDSDQGMKPKRPVAVQKKKSITSPKNSDEEPKKKKMKSHLSMPVASSSADSAEISDDFFAFLPTVSQPPAFQEALSPALSALFRVFLKQHSALKKGANNSTLNCLMTRAEVWQREGADEEGHVVAGCYRAVHVVLNLLSLWQKQVCERFSSESAMLKILCVLHPARLKAESGKDAQWGISFIEKIHLRLGVWAEPFPLPDVLAQFSLVKNLIQGKEIGNSAPESFWFQYPFPEAPVFGAFACRVVLSCACSIAEVERLHAHFNSIKTLRRVSLGPDRLECLTLTSLNLPDKMEDCDLQECLNIAEKEFGLTRSKNLRGVDKRKRGRIFRERSDTPPRGPADPASAVVPKPDAFNAAFVCFSCNVPFSSADALKQHVNRRVADGSHPAPSPSWMLEHSFKFCVPHSFMYMHHCPSCSPS